MQSYIKDNLEKIKKSCLIFDIETSAQHSDGNEISIQSEYDLYVENAKVKWIGLYSYKYNKEYYLNYQKDYQQIKDLFFEHNILIGFNSEEFDFPICKNNYLIDDNKYYIHVDCLQILGKATFKNRRGYKYKNRGELMNYKFKSNSLKCISETMGVEYKKGSIDYKIFLQDEWTPEEIKEIKEYIKGDILSLKEIYEKSWNYWLPFSELLDEKYIYDLSWIRNSIASLTYKAACKVLNVEPTYCESGGSKEEMGGNVITPKYEEARDVFLVDFSSLYPHVMTMFNLFSEVDPSLYPDAWNGNKIFKTKGYYNVSKQNVLGRAIAERLEERIRLKETDKENPMAYTLKIFLNCFSDDTQIVMADNTIKNIKECKIGEYVWSINPITLFAEKKKIIKTFQYDYHGDMHSYKGDYLNFKTTPNHRFLLHKVKSGSGKVMKQQFTESQQIQGNYKLPIHKNKTKNYKKIINLLDYFPKDYFLYSIKSKNMHGRTFLHKYKLDKNLYKYNCNDRNFIFDYKNLQCSFNKVIKNKNLDVFVFKNGRRREHKKHLTYNNNALSYLIGIYLSEGSLTKMNKKEYLNGHKRGEIYSVQLAQYKNINPIIYKKIQTCLDECKLKYSAGKFGFKITGSIFYDFLLNNFGKLDYKHFINKELFNDLNLMKVWEGLIDGDGTKKSRLYTTKYDCLKNDFIELCMRLGYTFVIKNDGCWRIRYNNSKNVFRSTMRTIENYNGKVYCVEVEDNNTLLAGRNNYFNWTGNSLYGSSRSSIFEKIHSENIGWDTCWLSQQIQQITIEMLESFGYETLYGDTDSWAGVAKNPDAKNKEYLQKCLDEIVHIIKSNCLYPVNTFKLNIEHKMEYALWPFTEQPVIDEQTGKNKKINNRIVKERKALKKNYLYIYKDKDKYDVKLVGLPIMKDNATSLGIKIYNEVLKPEILKQMSAKFDKEYIDNLVNEYLKNPEIMKLISREFKIKPFSSYKITKGKDSPTGIYAQISKEYFNGEAGVISLIKNNKIGKVGKGQLYCTVDEATNANLKAEDLDLEKLYNELEPFIKYVPKPIDIKEVKTKRKSAKGVDKALINMV